MELMELAVQVKCARMRGSALFKLGGATYDSMAQTKINAGGSAVDLLCAQSAASGGEFLTLVRLWNTPGSLDAAAMEAAEALPNVQAALAAGQPVERWACWAGDRIPGGRVRVVWRLGASDFLAGEERALAELAGLAPAESAVLRFFSGEDAPDGFARKIAGALARVQCCLGSERDGRAFAPPETLDELTGFSSAERGALRLFFTDKGTLSDLGKGVLRALAAPHVFVAPGPPTEPVRSRALDAFAILVGLTAQMCGALRVAIGIVLASASASASDARAFAGLTQMDCAELRRIVGPGLQA